ncbi:hypothetical protein C3B78_15350 [Arthrobacter sp. PGP41]|uniref:LPXTG cell wall anchor domain-containing protein n=1 Tax=Arthrobacter sp. PGP41 TaxID=2079227 RepID=UPI000CDC2DEF|nr:LPXTG cell wall anchor domain-containing protein [Arthrobacter sp. PGP41]AUZ35687.1 hypothetical protein C3B78_15350 [Arthrobacter sp. PGP41]
MSPVPPRRRAGQLGRLLAAVALGLGLGVTPAAYAAPADSYEPMRDVQETGQQGLLSLTSSVHPMQIPWLEPGDTFSWQIGLHLSDQPVADGNLEFIPIGGLLQPNTGYRLTAKRCESQWTGQSGTDAELECAAEARTLLADALLEAGPTARIPLGDVAASASPYILFTLTRPDESAVSGPFTFALGFTVMGDEAARDSSLPDTGFSGPLALTAGAVLVGAGVLTRLVRRKAGNP